MWAICFFCPYHLRVHIIQLHLSKISHQPQKQINLLLNAFINLNGQDSVTFCFYKEIKH